MDIVTVPFEEPLIVNVNGTTIRITAFKTLEHGMVKLGINAPRSIEVHREEIYAAIKQQQQNNEKID